MKTCVQYHDESSYDRHQMTGHYLDFANQPEVFKTYPGLDPILMPKEVTLPETKLSSLLSHQRTDRYIVGIGLETLSQVLQLSYTLTAKARYAEGDFFYRSAASAGALYPTEIYVATHGVRGLQNGLYHFALQHHGLVPLRAQDLSSHVLAMTNKIDNEAPVLAFFFTAIFFRSAWKYQARSYRYHLLDTGHVIENMVLALNALNLHFHLSYDFDDQLVNHLLGLDETREVVLAMIPVYVKKPECPTLLGGPTRKRGVLHDGKEVISRKEEELPGLSEEFKLASRVSQKEIVYPLIREMHAAGNCAASKKVLPANMIQQLGLTVPAWTGWNESLTWAEVMGYPEAVFRRRSSRNFVKKPITKRCMEALLGALRIQDPGSGGASSPYEHSLCIGLLIAHAEGMEPGFYLMDFARGSVGMVTAGSLTEKMAGICLDQAWLAYAGVHFLFLANLDAIDQVHGPRGYRYAMMTAGRMGERLYVTATAMGLGCCGIGALYDGEAAQLLGLNSPSRLLYLVALGQVKKV